MDIQNANGFYLVVEENRHGSTVQDALQIFVKEAREHHCNVFL